MDEIEQIRLVSAAQQGDRSAFDQLVLGHEQTVFAIVFRRLRNRSEALEVTQDVFLQVLRKLPQLREPERFPGWIRRIAVRLAINRAVRRPREINSEENTLGALRTSPDNPLQQMLQNENANEVWSGLDRLRDLDRRTLVAFYFNGQSLQEMSAEFSSPIGTIKRRLHTARNRLRDQLSKLEPVG